MRQPTNRLYKQNLASLDSMDSHQLDAFALKKFGHRFGDALSLMKIADKLNDTTKGTFTPSDVKLLQSLHPQVNPREIERLTSQINSAPFSYRRDAYLGMLAGDLNGAQSLPSFDQNFLELKELADNFTTMAISEAIQEKRGGTTQQQERPADPYSVRSLIKRQVGPNREQSLDLMSEPGQRLALSREYDLANHRLFNESEDLSLRDAVSNAYTSEAVESEARDRGLLPEE